MNPLGLGEHGEIATYSAEGGGYVASVRFRHWSGKGDRLRRRGKSRAEALRRLNEALEDALNAGTRGGRFTRASRFEEGYRGWLEMLNGLVERDRRSPTTRDHYVNVSERLILPALGDLRLGEITTPLLDQFVQRVLAEKGPSTAKSCRAVLSGVCGWLVRQGGLVANPVRDLTPIEVGEATKVARAFTADEVRTWLAALDADEYARRHDLPELARFMLATGVRIGEAVGVTWADVDLDAGTVRIERTIAYVKGRGLWPRR